MDGQDLNWESQALGQILERHAKERPQQEALITPRRRITYEDLYLRARSAAATIHSLGVGRGDHLGILMGNDEKWLSLFYGAAMIGAVTVPVNTRFKAAEIDFKYLAFEKARPRMQDADRIGQPGSDAVVVAHGTMTLPGPRRFPPRGRATLPLCVICRLGQSELPKGDSGGYCIPDGFLETGAAVPPASCTAFGGSTSVRRLSRSGRSALSPGRSCRMCTTSARSATAVR
jgi:hypothetical protein